MKRNVFFGLVLLSVWLFLMLPSLGLAAGCCLSAASGASRQDMNAGVSIIGYECKDVATETNCSALNYGNGLFYDGRICKVLPVGGHSCIVPSMDAHEEPASLLPSIYFTPQVGIPGSEFQPGAKIPLIEGEAVEDGRRVEFATGIGRYIAAAFKFVVGAVGFLAVIMLMYAGFQWLTAAGNPEKISHARETMINAALGVLLALGSYTLLHIINPNLIAFKGLKVPYVAVVPFGEGGEGTIQCTPGTAQCADCQVIPNNITVKNGNQAAPETVQKLRDMAAQGNGCGGEWRVTEAYPPVAKHIDKDHCNGRAIDIALVPPLSDKSVLADPNNPYTQRVQALKNCLQSNFGTVVDEYVNSFFTTTGPHFHVEP